MHRPVLVTPPEILPVSLAEAKLHLRVDHGDDDALIASLIKAAVDHLDGWTGILGRCLVEQTWRQDFDALAGCLPLSLAPVAEIVSVEYVDENGVTRTLDGSDYALRVDAGGRAFLNVSARPAASSASVTYKAGYPTIPEVPEDGDTPAVPAQSMVPDAIKAAILLLIGHWYANREAVAGEFSVVPMAVEALIAPYRRVGI